MRSLINLIKGSDDRSDPTRDKHVDGARTVEERLRKREELHSCIGVENLEGASQNVFKIADASCALCADRFTAKAPRGLRFCDPKEVRGLVVAE